MRLLLINNVAQYLDGGANRAIVESLEGFHRRGLTVGCLYHNGESALSSGIWVRRVNDRQPAAVVQKELLAALAEFQPDVIQCHSSQIMPTYPAWVPRYPVCQYVHDEGWFCSGANRVSRSLVHCQRPHSWGCFAWQVLEGCGGRSPVGNWIRWWDTQARTALHQYPHLRIQVASRFMARGFQENGFPLERVEVVPYGSATFGSGTHGEVHSVPIEPGLIVAPARLYPHKGVHFLVDAMAELKALPWRLVVPGDGPERARLQEQAHRLGLAERIEFPGELHPAAVAKWYDRAQLVAFPVIREEPFGLIGIEALAHGKPIVAFAGGAVDEWLWPGETGLKVTTKSPKALAAGIAELLLDPARCAGMGAAARRRFPRFTLDAFLDRLMTSFEAARTTWKRTTS